MGYTKQNFIKGQILKADHLNTIEDGIEVNDTAVAALSEEIEELKADIQFYYDIYSKTYGCDHTYEDISQMYFGALRAVYYDSQVTVTGEAGFNYMRALYVRHNRISAGTAYIEFTFLNHTRDGYITLRLNSDNTVTEVTE